MSRYPESIHLKPAAIISWIVGAFPWQLMFQSDRAHQNAYHLYTQCVLGCNVLCILSSFLELYSSCREETIQIDKICQNISVSFVQTSTCLRQIFMKLKPQFRHMMKLVIDTEKSIVDTHDEAVIKIFRDCARSTRKRIMIYTVLVICAISLSATKPFLVSEVIRRGNETIKARSFSLSMWMPFDKYVHFWEAYFFNCLWLVTVTFFTPCTDMIIFALITYPTGQLQILYHMMRNFDDYKRRAKLNCQVDDDEVAASIVLKKCVLMHQDIIRHIEYFNETMSIFMVVDFLQTTIQMAALLTQLIEFNNMTLTNQCAVVMYLGGSIYRTTMYYYYPNEILLLSQKLHFAVWESNWYKQSTKIKKMMQIMMMRCIKPLQINIGPFGYMNLESLVSIFKASYSYMMLIYNTK